MVKSFLCFLPGGLLLLNATPHDWRVHSFFLERGSFWYRGCRRSLELASLQCSRHTRFIIFDDFLTVLARRGNLTAQVIPS